MHEASIVGRLIERAAESAPPGARVLMVRVRVGRLTCISPDAMQFYFEALRDDSLGPQAELAVELPPLRARCARCGSAWELLEQEYRCPACGQPALVIENGDELELSELVVDDGEPDHDRAEDPQEER